MGVDKPNYTQIPNLLLDDLMMNMGEAELKVTFAIARLTFGYHRAAIEISLSDLKEITHMSRQGVVNGLTAGLERGTIGRTEGHRGGFIYELVINGEPPATSQRSGLVNEVDYPTSQRSGLPLVNEVDQTSQRNRPALVNEVDQNTPTLKKVLKKDLKKGSKERTLTPQQELFSAVCEAMGWDYNIVAHKDKQRVAEAITFLDKADYTKEDVRRFMLEVWFKDWRWEKYQQRPTLNQLLQEMGKLRAGVPETVSRSRNESKGSRSLSAVEEYFRRKALLEQESEQGK